MSDDRFSFDDLPKVKPFFDEKGYAIFTDVLTSEELKDFRAEVASIINAFLLKAGCAQFDPHDERIFTDGIQALEDVDHEYVASVYDTIFQAVSFLRIVSSARIERTIKALLGGKPDLPLYGFTNRCRIDPPTDDRRTYGWHQEVFYTIPEGKYLQTWAPLIFDTTTENGTIRIAPGSHKEGIAKQTWNEIPGRATQILVDAEIVAKYPEKTVEMKLGELLIFSGYLAHKSGRNASNQCRYSLVGMYHDVHHKQFKAPKLNFNFRGQSPRQFYELHFGSDK